MRGVRLELERTTAPYTVLVSYAAYENGTVDAGCAGFVLSQGATYTVKMSSIAKVRTNYIYVSDETGATRTKLFNNNIVGPSIDTEFTYHQVGGYQSWSTLTLTAWALYHRDAGVTNESWYVREVTCPAGSGFCFSCNGDGDAYDHPDCPGGTDSNDLPPGIHIGGLQDRFTILHEFGHLLYRKRDEYQKAGYGLAAAASSQGCAQGGDDVHELQSKETYARAFYEGFADFYAVVSLNDQNDDDCFVSYNKDQNYDLDGDLVADNEDATTLQRLPTNCKGNPGIFDPSGPTWISDPLDSAIDEYDYLYDSNVTLECGGTPPPIVIDNRATSLDFSRFWWWLYTEKGWSFRDIVDVIDLLETDEWDGDDVPTANVADQPAGYQAVAMYDLANALAITDQMRDDWLDGLALHGLDR